MRKAVVSIAFGDAYSKVAELSHPTFAAYAKRCDADYVVIRNRVFRDNIHPHWEKLRIGSMLEWYDRVIYLDTDMIVASDAPSLFEVVPFKCFGAMNEALYGDRLNDLEEGGVQHGLSGLVFSEYRYYNLGVMVFDKNHEELFRLPANFTDRGMPEQTCINLRLLKSSIPVVDVGLAFNRLYCVMPTERYLEGFIIHYAGWPNSDRDGMLLKMREDLGTLRDRGRLDSLA